MPIFNQNFYCPSKMLVETINYGPSTTFATLSGADLLSLLTSTTNLTKSSRQCFCLAFCLISTTFIVAVGQLIAKASRVDAAIQWMLHLKSKLHARLSQTPLFSCSDEFLWALRGKKCLINISTNDQRTISGFHSTPRSHIVERNFQILIKKLSFCSRFCSHFFAAF